ncbi:uncharacterized protein CMU_015020 [Cryptosporidium muris RN66]|uniref:Phosducin domain-containing protein n=1 Tax=Cryptosporidium muris (strain RN66) TaxID=441375 RepID=B6AF59_CRYMR|nr:uncharacterized protein CMU_015020 [Cryptosporidium muris RN66]EEA06826.1 hypothetical protein, conserved [Cryptosporidium muris RN66]|eukprot:XP_002141175.1 hypothetical protein [Cryptosporidium muris RN66]
MSTTNPTDITTQWEDQLVKRGIWQPRSCEIKNEEIYEHNINELSKLSAFDVVNIEQIGESTSYDDEEIDRELQLIRERRLASLKKKAMENNRFGELYFITKCDFVKEVSEASKYGIYVVLHLYTEYIEDCLLVNKILSEVIAPKYSSIKFVKGISTNIIPNYPDKSLPTIIIYRNGTKITQIVGSSKLKDESSRITPNSICKVLEANSVFKGDDDIKDQTNEDDYGRKSLFIADYRFKNKRDINSDKDELDNSKCYSSMELNKLHDKVKYVLNQ